MDAESSYLPVCYCPGATANHSHLIISIQGEYGVFHWDTGAYTAEGGLGPTYSTGGGDVRSGIVVGPDNQAYWGSADGGIYQLTINELLVLAK